MSIYLCWNEFIRIVEVFACLKFKIGQEMVVLCAKSINSPLYLHHNYSYPSGNLTGYCKRAKRSEAGRIRTVAILLVECLVDV